MSTEGMWTPSDQWVLWREAMTLHGTIVERFWRERDEQRPTERLLRIISRSCSRLDRRAIH